jgi:hypothetical protein
MAVVQSAQTLVVLPKWEKRDREHILLSLHYYRIEYYCHRCSTFALNRRPRAGG